MSKGSRPDDELRFRPQPDKPQQRGQPFVNQVLRRLALLLNPGSVGLPAFDDDHIAFHVHQTGSPHARYALCESDAQGRWSVAQIAVAYDWSAAVAQATRNGAADWARWLATGLA